MGKQIKDLEVLSPATITDGDVIIVQRGDKSYQVDLSTVLSEGLIEVTYDELKTRRDTGVLRPGQQYRMVDYETIISGDTYRSAGHVYDLILTAKSENSFYEECKAIHSSRDTENYFTNSDLDSWRLWYTMDPLLTHVPIKGKYKVVDMFEASDPTYYMWLWYRELPDGTHSWSGSLNEATAAVLGYNINFSFVCTEESLDTVTSVTMGIPEQGVSESVEGEEAVSFVENLLPLIVEEGHNEVGNKGYVYRMIDEFNNDCPYDFKNVQYLISLVNKSFGYNDSTGLTNGWAYNYAGVDNASDQWVYTFNRTDDNHVYYDLSLNYKSGDLSCKNNYMHSYAGLPKNIILTCDEMAYRGSDGLPEPERVMNNNYFGEGCINNIFNICSDTIFEENCAENVGFGLYKNTLNNVGQCVFDNNYMAFNNSKLEQCYNCKFTRVNNCDLYHMQGGTNGWLTNSTIQYVNCNLPYVEECVIKSWTNITTEKSLRFYNSTLNLSNVSIKIPSVYVYFYNSNINVSNCTWTVPGNNIYNLDALVDKVDFSTETNTMMYISKYKTFVRTNLDNEICIYTELDLFNQAGASYLVDALNTAI